MHDYSSILIIRQLFRPSSHASIHSCMQVLVVDTNQLSGLETVVSTVTAAVGPPHNYSSSSAVPSPSQLADVSRPATAPAAADQAAEPAAAAPQPEGLKPEQVSWLHIGLATILPCCILHRIPCGFQQDYIKIASSLWP